MAVGNMHHKFGKDRTCSSGDILTERQTERYTDTQYLRTSYGGFQGDECILRYTMLQVTTGAIANLSTRISQLLYICRLTTIILSGSILP